MPRLTELRKCHVLWKCHVLSRGNATSCLMEIIISMEELSIQHLKYCVLPCVEK